MHLGTYIKHINGQLWQIFLPHFRPDLGGWGWPRELHLFTFARTWTHLFPAVYIYRAGVTCVRWPAPASNWATVCLNTRLGAKGNTDVSGLTCRCQKPVWSSEPQAWLINPCQHTYHKPVGRATEAGVCSRVRCKNALFLKLTGRWP